MDTSTLMDLYRDMRLIRAFEQGLERESERGNVPGMLHTGLGQEATQAALAWHLRATDTFFPDHRCHGINALAQQRHGGNGERIMAELFGRATGVCSGKGEPAPARARREPRKPRAKVRKASFTQALNNALDLAMDKHPEMFLIGEDTAEMGGDFGVTAEQAAADGVSVEVVDLRTVRPYDADTVLASVAKTGRAVVANEAPKIGGLGAELSARISEECFADLRGPVVRVDGLDTPIPFSAPLEHVVLPGTDDIATAISTAAQY